MSLGPAKPIEGSAQQRALLLVALLATLVATVFLPLSFFTTRWVVLDTPTETKQLATTLTLHSTVTTEYGLYETCTITPKHESCTREYAANMGAPTSCSIDGESMRHRMNSSLAFLILAWLVCLPLFFINLVYVFKGDTVGHKDRKMGVLVRLALTGVAFLFALIGICVFGGTMSDWAGCGNHFCTVLSQQAQIQAQAQWVPKGSNVTQAMDIHCGYGYSFAGSIVSLVALIGTLLFIVCEYTSEGSEVAATEADGDATSTDEPTKKTSAPPTAQGDNQQQQDQQHPPPSEEEDTATKKNQEVQETMPTSHVQEEEESKYQNRGHARAESKDRAHPREQRSEDSGYVQAEYSHQNQSSTSRELHQQSSSPSYQRQQSLSQQRAKAMPEGDDWSFDQNHQLYWSPTQKLYFDADSGHFYDPDSQLWFDPNAGRWYSL